MKKNLSALATGSRMVARLLFVMMMPSALLTACEHGDDEPDPDAGLTIRVNGDSIPTHTVITFDIGGMQMSQSSMTRATLAEENLTDLWLFDYMGDDLVQTIHQTPDDANFGRIALSAEYGEHQLCFVAARGDTPTIDGTTLSWAKPSDTFWQSITLNVQPGTAASQSVALQRVATRLRISVTDEIPAGLAMFTITPQTWYYGLDVRTGEAADSRTTPRSVTVPESYQGTTGQLSMSFFGMSPADPWQTDIRLTATASDESALADITLTGASFRRNVLTQYSGELFSHSGNITISVDGDWSDDNTNEW